MIPMGNDYIINSILEDAIKRYQDAKDGDDEKELNESQEELAELFYLLAENIIKAFNFKLIDYDDALQEGVMICIQKVDRFNPDYVGQSGVKAKAFNYMTTCILNHYRQLYRGAKSYHEFLSKYHEHLIDKVEHMYLSMSAHGHKVGAYRFSKNEVKD